MEWATLLANGPFGCPAIAVYHSVASTVQMHWNTTSRILTVFWSSLHPPQLIRYFQAESLIYDSKKVLYFHCFILFENPPKCLISLIFVLLVWNTVWPQASIFKNSQCWKMSLFLWFSNTVHFCIPPFPFWKIETQKSSSELRLEKFARRLERLSFVKIQISLHTQILTLKMRDLFHHWFLTRGSIPRTNQPWCSTCLVITTKVKIRKQLFLSFEFAGDKPQKLLLKHQDLNREMNLVRNFWDLDETSSLLHSMSLYNPFGIVDSLMSPLSAGGRVVLLPQFDTTKVSFLFNLAK